MNQDKIRVPSIHKPSVIDVSGFEEADESLHMIEWLRRGKDFREFVTSDIESELYAQDSGAQLLSLECEKPELQTNMRRDVVNNRAIVTEFCIVFPVRLTVKGGDGRLWKLEVKHGYKATNMDVPGNFKLTMNFSIMDHQLRP
ncbi:MAG TPA: hypothetical protein VN679_05320 [Candidatus Acidoferrales bacterium]|nr:hypothetical protein [Candidatus Acidoferrales bacterium]